MSFKMPLNQRAGRLKEAAIGVDSRFRDQIVDVPRSTARSAYEAAVDLREATAFSPAEPGPFNGAELETACVCTEKTKRSIPLAGMVLSEFGGRESTRPVSQSR